MAKLLIYPRAGVSKFGLSYPAHSETIEGTKLAVTKVVGGIEFKWDDRRIVTSLSFILID